MKALSSIVVICLVYFCITGVFATPVYADTGDPDSVTPPVFYGQRNLLEDDDFLLYFPFGVNYASTPSDPIYDTFDFVLYDTDGVTILGNREAYDFVNDGYNDNMLGFYFSADDAPTWGQEYILSIRGKPSAFDDPPIYTYTVPTTAYTSTDTQATNQEEVRLDILSIARDLSSPMDVDLLEQSETGEVLSSYGEQLFRNAIPGLQAMVPELFSVVLYTPNYPELERSWSGNVSENYSGRYDDTEEYSAISGFWEQMFNIEFNLGAAIPVVFACIVFIVASVKISNEAYSGMLNSAMALTVATPWGVMPMAMLAVGGLLSAFVSSFKLFRPS